jgi:hypothetical protein
LSSEATTTKPQTDTLPGELEPLVMRYGGDPIKDEEALGVARRLARVQEAQGRNLSAMSAPDALPPIDARMVQSAHRFPPRLLYRVRAKAEMEGVTVTAVLREAMEAYANSSPGAKVTYTARRPQV